MAMKKHLLFSYAFCKESSQDRSNDGKRLGLQLLANIQSEPLPLKLLISFATPEFQDFADLLSGIRSVSAKTAIEDNLPLASVPLIGCSISGCVTNEGIFQTGAVLVGLCSDSIKVKCGVGQSAADQPRTAIDQLIDGLGLRGLEHDINPDGNRVALLFLPGYKVNAAGQLSYHDTELHRFFCQSTNYQIPTIGGSAAVGLFRRLAGWQFLDSDIFQNAVVGCLLECDVKFGLAMGAGLQETNDFVRIKGLEPDGRTVTEFDGPPSAMERIRSAEEGSIAFGIRNEDGDPTIVRPMINDDGSMTFWREIDAHRDLQILLAHGNRAEALASTLLHTACRRAAIQPREIAGAIGFICGARSRFFGRDRNWMVEAHRRATETIQHKPIVCVYVNGECGMDGTGRPVHNNMQISGCVFGSDLFTVAQVRKGYQALADASKAMIQAMSLDETIIAALTGLEKAGFKGA